MSRIRVVDNQGLGVAVLEGEEALALAVRPVQSEDATRRALRWIDLEAPHEESVQHLGRAFGFHPLTLEDCLHFDQRPKLEEYPGADPYLFVVIHNFEELDRVRRGEVARVERGVVMPAEELELDLGETTGKAVYARELHAFLGRGYLVTVHQQPIAALELVLRRVKDDPALLSRGADFLYYLLADALCDSNFPVLERLNDSLDDIEEAILSQPAKTHLHHTYLLRKVLVQMRKVLSPQRDVLAVMTRMGGNTCIAASNAAYFRDVHDHLVRITESIESGRDLLGNCVDAYLSAVGQRTNEIMKQLTILSAMMLPLSFLSGFFGMNFEQLPFKSPVAFAGCMVLMFVLVPGGMLIWFRRSGWL